MSMPVTIATRRMRILIVVPTYYPAVRYGGPIRCVHGLAMALARRGHDVQVYTTTMDGDKDLDVPSDRPVDLDGVKVHYFPVPALRRLFWSPEMGKRLRESVSEFDIVHLHAVFVWPLLAGARAAARAGVPYVMTPHGMLIRDLIRAKSRWVKTAWINLVERTSLARAAALHVTAELEHAEIRALRLPVPAIVASVPNGVDWPAQHLPLAQTPFAGLTQPYALFLSRINWKKGLDRLITAWQWVPNLPLIIAGNDEEGYREQLERLARSLGIAARVIFIGPVDDQHKWGLYESAELFLLPSYSENFGIVVAEAMLMACPVLVTPEVGISELVKATDSGVVTGNDPVNLAAAINELLADEPRRRELAHRGREAARRHLAWSGVVEQMEDLYWSVLDQRTPVGASA
jgi:glycosyltransferase involved in cell wall biosynthesis